MAGDPKAQRELGLRRESGDGVAMSKLEAARWYRRAAEKEGANAQNGLAMRREFGDGPPQRDAQAIKWPKMAAEGGRLQAMRDLAPLIEKEGSETSRQAAMGWCRKAVERGDPASAAKVAQAAENAAGAKTSAMTSAMNKGEDVREGGAMEPSPALAQNQALSSAPAQTPPQAKAQTPSQS